MTPLPTLPLESIQVASPCDVSWDSMTGDERKRFCGQCTRHVFNLSGLDRAAAEALVGAAAGSGERLCVRYFVRQDGTVLTADCPKGLRAARKRLAAIGAALTGLAAALAGVVGLTRPRDDERNWFEPSRARMVMGEMMISPPTPPPTAAPVISLGSG